jgi:hypothetical protein
MQQCRLLLATLYCKLPALQGVKLRCPLRHNSSNAHAAKRKAVPASSVANVGGRPPASSMVPEKPILPPRALARKKHSRLGLLGYSRRIDRLIATTPPASVVEAVKSMVLSPYVPGRLRPRVLVKASYAFLRHGDFVGSLAMYKLLLSQRFAPPLSLIALMYHAANVRSAHRATKRPKTCIDPLPSSLAPMNDHLLALLLSTLESSQQPEVMEDIVRNYATQFPPSCLTDASVVASMIRGYHAARQLDGCYTWFYRYRNSPPTKSECSPVTPYVCLMAASRKLDPTNTKALYRILKMIQEDGVPLTTLAYNEVLASELYNRNFERVFSLFSSLQDSSASLRPDGYTFSLVFDALWKNETGPRLDTSLSPGHIFDQMIKASETNHSSLTVFNANAALRYFVHVGNFQSAISVIDATLSARVSPNTLTIRWTLEGILKRYQAAFAPTASCSLENWAKALLGGLTRDHFAHSAHLLDVVRSTRTDNESHKLTRTARDALQLVHNVLVSGRTLASFATKVELQETPGLSMIRNILQVCVDPACGHG